MITNEKDKNFSTTYVEILEKVDEYFPCILKPVSSDTSAM